LLDNVNLASIFDLVILLKIDLLHSPQNSTKQ
jgi:hypothetical protein